MSHPRRTELHDYFVVFWLHNVFVPGDVGAGVLPDFCQGPPPDLAGSAEGSDTLGRNARANVNCRASATFADEALRFVREFDVAEHDPALTYRCKNTFLHRARVLFSEGRIWESRNTDISEADATPLDIVWHQARTAPALYYDTDCKART